MVTPSPKERKYNITPARPSSIVAPTQTGTRCRTRCAKTQIPHRLQIRCGIFCQSCFWNNLQFDAIKQFGWRHDLDWRIGKSHLVTRDDNISSPLLRTRNLNGILKIGMFLSKVSLYALSLQGHKPNYRNHLLHKQLCMLASLGSTKNIDCITSRQTRKRPFVAVHAAKLNDGFRILAKRSAVRDIIQYHVGIKKILIQAIRICLATNQRGFPYSRACHQD